MSKEKNEFIPNIIKSTSYWRVAATDEGIEDTSLPILVNCTGYEYPEKTFDVSRTHVDYYLMLMDGGTIKLLNNDKYVDFTKGQFIIYKKGTPYHYHVKNGAEETGFYWVRFTGFFVEQLMEKAGIEFDTVYTCDCDIQEFGDIFKSIFREVFKREQNFELDTGALIMRLIVKLGKAIYPEWKNKVSTLRFKNSLSHIHTNYMKNIDVKTLADMEELSVSRYRTLFREMTGMAPAEYIINLKIQHACELLFCTSYSVTEVAAMCGYTDVLYFIRIFKKKTGVTPGKYKEKLTQKTLI